MDKFVQRAKEAIKTMNKSESGKIPRDCFWLGVISAVLWWIGIRLFLLLVFVH